MPTDLPPDYKPKPAADANDPLAPAPGGDDAVDGKPGVPQPGPGVGVGLPGSGGDVPDPAGTPGGLHPGSPAPAGMPTF